MKTVLLLAFILLPQVTSIAQDKSPSEIKELFYDAEFFFAQEEYTDALYDYLELYQNGFKGNANINYRIGSCYLNIPGQKEKSIDYLLEAVKNISKKYSESNIKQESAPYDAYLYLGNAYRVNNRLNDAINAYSKYKEVAGTTEGINYADQQITACKTALRFMGNPLQLRFNNLGDSINTSSSNYKGVVSGDGKTLLFMSKLPFYDAIYASNYNKKGWSSPTNITPQIQSDGNQYVSSVSFDGEMLILTKEDPFNSDLYQSSFKDGQWTKSLPLSGEDINTKFWESHASISKDGKKLYFTSNRKEGIGEMDIYVSKQNTNGRWDKPSNLGPVINTPLNEDTPFITENDSMLFFSSQGHENMGGYDVFVSRMDVNGKWTEPVNIGYPLNTTDDDLFYYPWNNARVGYISRIEKNGFGREDIYAVQDANDKELDSLLADFIYGPETREPAPVAIETAEKETAEASDTDRKTTVEPPKEIALEPVYFAFDNFQLNDEGRSQLDKIVQLLNEFPVIHIKLIGHADARGAAEYNLKLSEKRAMAANNYITGLGIDPARIVTTGMGEKNFAAINANADGSDNPAGRKLNRRVDYEIFGSNNTLILIKMTPVPEYLKIKK